MTFGGKERAPSGKRAENKRDEGSRAETNIDRFYESASPIVKQLCEITEGWIGKKRKFQKKIISVHIFFSLSRKKKFDANIHMNS